MGTAQDQLDLLDGDLDKLAGLEESVARHLGFTRVLDSVGQVYPRSLDLDVVAALVQAAAGPSSLATTIRLMAGHELVTEGFAPGQVGSSAMPHKMNTRSCERINGLMTVLRGHLTMAASLAGDQWNEGDVSCSVVRRVVLPDAFFATDGVFQTLLTVLDELGAYPGDDRARARSVPAVPRHDEGVDWQRYATASAARWRTRRSGSTRWPWRSNSASRAPRATTCCSGWRQIRGCS